MSFTNKRESPAPITQISEELRIQKIRDELSSLGDIKFLVEKDILKLKEIKEILVNDTLGIEIIKRGKKKLEEEVANLKSDVEKLKIISSTSSKISDDINEKLKTLKSLEEKIETKNKEVESIEQTLLYKKNNFDLEKTEINNEIKDLSLKENFLLSKVRQLIIDKDVALDLLTVENNKLSKIKESISLKNNELLLLNKKLLEENNNFNLLVKENNIKAVLIIQDAEKDAIEKKKEADDYYGIRNNEISKREENVCFKEKFIIQKTSELKYVKDELESFYGKKLDNIVL